MNRSQIELLHAHVRALYTMDSEDRLVAVNEPWDKSRPAPRVYVGRTLDSSFAFYTRRDLPGDVGERVLALIQRGLYDPHAYAAMLGAPEAVCEICYALPLSMPEDSDAVSLTPFNLSSFDLQDFGRLPEEIETALPCCGYPLKGRLVSVCRSVRVSDTAHEAGIETAAAYRGRGYAQRALAAWSAQVRAIGKIPLYSTLKTNLSSQRLAQKAGLHPFAQGFFIP